MDEIRINRIRSMIKDELSVMVNRKLNDPRVPFVTVTNVEMPRDAKLATVFISILTMNQTHSDPVVVESCIENLMKNKGSLRKHLSNVLKLRYVPDLLFKEDKGLENTLRVNELLKQIADEKK